MNISDLKAILNNMEISNEKNPIRVKVYTENDGYVVPFGYYRSSNRICCW